MKRALVSCVSHLRPEPDGSFTERPLDDHLRGVAAKAVEFAGCFGAGDWAHEAGIRHDLGKYRPGFQRYIRAQNDPDAHIEGGKSGRVDHSTAGAIHAREKFGNIGNILAYLIAGHHAGLPDCETADSGRSALHARLEQGKRQGYLEDALSAQIPDDILKTTAPTSKPLGGREGFHLWVRMLFSCLVDADFLDTEGFMDSEKGRARKGFPEIEAMRSALDTYMHGLMSGKTGTVNELRADIYRQCCEKAASRPGLFSLTVPTGGGKTLASLAFALRHAEQHEKRRVIYAIPFTSIIEQTADVFRAALGEYADALVEHHSNAESDPKRESHKTRLACENWDAPLIVTTNVQLFESLFAARTSRCRKLHNLVNSVIVLDEAQTLPPEFLQPIVNVMRLLSEHYGVTFVFCTATQPELGSRKGFDAVFKGLDGIREIMDDVGGLYAKLKRVEVRLPADLHTPVTWEALADELAGINSSVLCIVNRRKDCRTLYDLLRRRDDAPVYHRSALMCGQHRSEVIAEIKQRLNGGDTVKVISTQLVEAGVDLDFPVVYRALAGLDAIAQAAGRCNREGRLEVGEVRVFIPPPGKLPELLQRAISKTKETLFEVEDDPLTPDNLKVFFELFFSATNSDGKRVSRLLAVSKVAAELREPAELSFRTAAERFRLINEEYSETLFVKYGEGVELISLLETQRPERQLMRKLQRYAVSIPKCDMNRLELEGQVKELFPGIFVQITDTLYQSNIGVVTNPTVSAFSPMISE